MGDGLDELLSCHAVLDGAPEVECELLGIAASSENRDGDQAAVAGREFGSVPDVLEEHVVGEFRELGSEVAEHAAPSAGLLGLICHCVGPFADGSDGGGVDDEAVAHVGPQHALIRVVDGCSVDELDLGGDAVPGAEVQHLLRLGNASDT